MKLFCFLIFSSIVINIYSQSGFLDRSFGRNGKVISAIGLQDVSYSFLSKIGLQRNGNIIVGGESGFGPENSSSIVVMRYTPEGRLDEKFGNGGVVIQPPLKGRFDECTDLIVLPDGNILIAGSSEDGTSDLVLLKYLSNGILDSSFGQNGVIFTDFSNLYDRNASIAFQKDGKLLLGGESGGNTYSNQFSLARYDQNGKLDSSFGANGKTAISLTQCEFNELSIQSDGKIVLEGYSTVKSPYSQNLTLVRFLADGSIDQSFGKSGKVITHVDGFAFFPSGMDILSNDEILVSTTVRDGNYDYYLAIYKYKKDGIIDSSFGNGGSVINYFLGEGEESGITVQPDGKILQAGNLYSNQTFILSRYNKNGSIDSSFGTNGSISAGVGKYRTSTLRLQNDLKILTGGYSTGHFALARFYNDTIKYTDKVVNSFSNNISKKGVIFKYPNPATSILMIDGLSSLSTEIITISKYSGQTLKKMKVSGVSSYTVDIASLPEGLYFVNILEGDKKTQLKFIKRN